MKTKKDWFGKAVMARPPYTLGGWHKNQSSEVRRMHALDSRPKSWSLNTRRRSAGQALIALANVTKDKPTAEVARADAHYFFRLLKEKVTE